MKQPLALVGTGPECTVRLNGEGVDRYHCALVLTSAGLWAVDLQGRIESAARGGLRFNGDGVRFCSLDAGDVLRIGGFSMTATISRGESDAELNLSARREVAELVGPTVDSLRRDYEAKLALQAERHRSQVAELSREVEDLRDWVEELRSRLNRKSRRNSGRARRVETSSALGATQTDVRVLGAAIRRRSANPANLPACFSGAGLHVESSRFATAPVDSTAVVVRPDHVDLRSRPANSWPDVDSRLSLPVGNPDLLAD
jgi:hypothetical protein